MNQQLIPEPELLPDDLPFKEAAELDVSLSDNDKKIIDIFINDSISSCPDLDDNTA